MSDNEKQDGTSFESSSSAAGPRGVGPDHHAIVLHVWLKPGERFAGWIGAAGSPPRLAFGGWLDFMVAVASLKAWSPAPEP
jgi:hypothetical protein